MRRSKYGEGRHVINMSTMPWRRRMEIVRWSGDAPWWPRAVVMVDVEEESCEAPAIMTQARPIARVSSPRGFVPK
jgi:hypothetical protein